MLKVTASKLRYFWYIYISYQMYANWYPPLLINFLIFSTQDILIPTPSPINYWGKFPNQTNFLKQSPCAEFFAISQKEWPICSDESRVFLGRLVTSWNSPPPFRHHGWGKFLNLKSPDALKMHSLAMPVLRFFWKTFSKLHKSNNETLFSMDV